MVRRLLCGRDQFSDGRIHEIVEPGVAVAAAPDNSILVAFASANSLRPGRLDVGP